MLSQYSFHFQIGENFNGFIKIFIFFAFENIYFSLFYKFLKNNEFKNN